MCMKQIIVIGLLLCLCGICRGQKQFQPDTTINGKLVLENPQSVKTFLPDLQSPEICENRMRPYPFSLFVDNTGTTYLWLIATKAACAMSIPVLKSDM